MSSKLQLFTDADRERELRRRLASEVAIGDLVLAVSGDPDALERIRKIVRMIRLELLEE